MFSAFTALTDEKLVQLAGEGNPDAFVELSDRYMSLIRAKAASFHSFALEADDLWQEGLLGLFNAATTYDPKGGASFQTYAGVCISNRIIAAYRSSSSQKHTILNESLSCQDESFSDRDRWMVGNRSLSPETQVIAEESVKAVRDHLNSALSPMEKDVLWLYLNGWSYGEIANQLSISPKAAGNAIQRVRKKLKSHLSHD